MKLNLRPGIERCKSGQGRIKIPNEGGDVKLRKVTSSREQDQDCGQNERAPAGPETQRNWTEPRLRPAKLALGTHWPLLLCHRKAETSEISWKMGKHG